MKTIPEKHWDYDIEMHSPLYLWYGGPFLPQQTLALYGDWHGRRCHWGTEARASPDFKARRHAMERASSDFGRCFKQRPKSEETRSIVACITRIDRLSNRWKRRPSCMQRFVTYVSMQRLNHMALLYVHQQAVDNLDLTAIQESFIATQDSRQHIFGCIDSAGGQ